jgi:hypothetical protein
MCDEHVLQQLRGVRLGGDARRGGDAFGGDAAHAQEQGGDALGYEHVLRQMRDVRLGGDAWRGGDAFGGEATQTQTQRKRQRKRGQEEHAKGGTTPSQKNGQDQQQQQQVLQQEPASIALGVEKISSPLEPLQGASPWSPSAHAPKVEGPFYTSRASPTPEARDAEQHEQQQQAEGASQIAGI